jgi:hypothetical protein
MTKDQIIYALVSRADRTITARIVEVLKTKLTCFRDGDRSLLKLKTLCLDLMEVYE